MTSVASAARSELDDSWVFHPATELASAVISFIVYVGLLGWHAGMATFVAVLVHEAGHWLALKHYGVRTKGILFLVVMAATPFVLGAKHNRYQDAMVSLAGPLTGIPLGIIYLLLYKATGDMGYAVGVYVIVTLNVFNLIPIGRLDGGWVLVNLRANLRHSESLMLGFGLTVAAATLITSMWSMLFGLLMAGFLIYKLMSEQSTANPRLKKKRLMTNHEFVTVQSLYAVGIIGMALVLMITGSASELGDAYMKMIGEQLSGIWYAIRG